jgi:hypothetical protein
MEFDFAKAIDPDEWLEIMAYRIHRRAPASDQDATAIGVFI